MNSINDSEVKIPDDVVENAVEETDMLEPVAQAELTEDTAEGGMSLFSLVD